MRLDRVPWEGPNSPLAEASVTAKACEDRRFLADVLSRTAPGEEASGAADRLLTRFGDLAGVLGATQAALAGTPGVSEAAAADLIQLRELATRLAAVRIGPRPLISSWNALLAYVGQRLRHERREQFRVLFLDVRNGLLRDEKLGEGTIDHAPVYVREVMRRALELGAASLILVHNHPAGDPTPSRADIDITRQIVEAGKALRVAVHDHLIVGRAEVASFKSLGLL